MTAAEKLDVADDMTERELWDIGDMPDLPAPAEDGTIPPQFIPDPQIAEDTLRWLAYWYGERERVVEMATRERMRIADLERRQLERIDRRIAWHEGGLRSFLLATGKRAWKGLRGAVSFRTGRERVEVQDEAAFLAWADTLPAEQEHEVVRTTVAPSKSGIAAWIKDAGAGELPPGVELVRSEDALVVKVEG